MLCPASRRGAQVGCLHRRLRQLRPPLCSRVLQGHRAWPGSASSSGPLVAGSSLQVWQLATTDERAPARSVVSGAFGGDQQSQSTVDHLVDTLDVETLLVDADQHVSRRFVNAADVVNKRSETDIPTLGDFNRYVSSCYIVLLTISSPHSSNWSSRVTNRSSVPRYAPKGAPTQVLRCRRPWTWRRLCNLWLASHDHGDTRAQQCAPSSELPGTMNLSVPRLCVVLANAVSFSAKVFAYSCCPVRVAERCWATSAVRCVKLCLF